MASLAVGHGMKESEMRVRFVGLTMSGLPEPRPGEIPCAT
jgi:hypothetical protein